MLNTRSDYLVVLIATYNRLNLLKRTLDSIAAGTRCSHEVIVIDGGSTDGTIEYLQSHPGITPVFQGELLGTSRAYNVVWRQIESKYTCWLSDDTEVVNGSLDLAVGILAEHPEIGMVGLKMKDTAGPWKDSPYLGGLSEYKILNCNHGLLPTRLLRSVGYFNESYRSYMIDPDLTASVLCTGKSVVMTKRVSVLHHREWSESGWKEKVKQEQGGIDNDKVYREKFKFLEVPPSFSERVKQRVGYPLMDLLSYRSAPNATRLGLNWRDRYNIIEGRFIRLTDPLENIGRPYHLIQKIPRNLLMSAGNPYRHLVE